MSFGLAAFGRGREGTGSVGQFRSGGRYTHTLPVNRNNQHGIYASWSGRDRMVWYGMVRYGMVWYGMVWCGMVWCGMVWCGMLLYGWGRMLHTLIHTLPMYRNNQHSIHEVRSGRDRMVWYGMVWVGMVWYGISTYPANV